MTDLEQYPIRGASAAELVRSVEDGVASGALVPGQPLPSVRRLAASVGLSPATVAAGISELRRRGVIVSEARRGTRIGYRPPISSARATLAVPPGGRDLSSGNPDPALLPDLGAELACIECPVRLYGRPPSLPDLLAAARARLSADGVRAESLCVVSGALDGIERVLEVCLRPGDRVAVESPGYAALFDLLRARGLAMEPVAIDERGMLPAALARALARGARAAIITPRGHNPTGACLDAGRARALGDAIAGRRDLLVVEDDHLGDVAGTPLHSVAAIAPRWALARSVAKELGPDLRLAILAGDPHTLAGVQGRQECGPGWVSSILQRLVLSLWAKPAVRALIAHASNAYGERRACLLEALAARGISASGPSGLNVWVPVADEAAVVGGLLGRGWVVAPGARFQLTQRSPAIRVTIAELSAARAAQFAEDLHAVIAPARLSRAG